MWFVKADDQIFGPFADERLPLFVAERRLSERTLIALSMRGPFAPAGLEPQLRYLFELEEDHAAGATDVGHASATASTVVRPEAVGIAVGAKIGVGDAAVQSLRTTERAEAPLLVIAERAAMSPTDFHARLEGFGAVDVVVGGVFLVTTDLGATDLRNALSRGLGPESRLLVVEVSRAHAAWFNLSDKVERRLFDL